MGMGRQKDREKQQDLWMAASEIVTTPGHVFYERLNVVLNAEKFDQRIEAICRKYYKSNSGRPSITPGTYFRMLLLGYFEGIDSERGIAWRAADSFSSRRFLGYDLSEPTPDHSTVSRTRRLYSMETHGAAGGATGAQPKAGAKAGPKAGGKAGAKAGKKGGGGQQPGMDTY